jgi:hypothetical protein
VIDIVVLWLFFGTDILISAGGELLRGDACARGRVGLSLGQWRAGSENERSLFVIVLSDAILDWTRGSSLKPPDHYDRS